MSKLNIDELYLREAFRIQNAISEHYKVTKRYNIVAVEQYNFLKEAEKELTVILNSKDTDDVKTTKSSDILENIRKRTDEMNKMLAKANKEEDAVKYSAKILYDVLVERYPGNSYEELQEAVAEGIINLKSLGKL
jgi:Xaa-Pro aminopeptidase